jgi:hypothetical protein
MLKPCAEIRMSATAIRGESVAKKKTDSGAKRYGTLIRVSDKFADALRDAASFEKLSIAEFADAHLLAPVEKRYKEAVIKEARRIEGKN